MNCRLYSWLFCLNLALNTLPSTLQTVHYNVQQIHANRSRINFFPVGFSISAPAPGADIEKWLEGSRFKITGESCKTIRIPLMFSEPRLEGAPVGIQVVQFFDTGTVNFSWILVLQVVLSWKFEVPAWVFVGTHEGVPGDQHGTSEPAKFRYCLGPDHFQIWH